MAFFHWCTPSHSLSAKLLGSKCILQLMKQDRLVPEAPRRAPITPFKLEGEDSHNMNLFCWQLLGYVPGEILLLFASLMCASTRTKEERWKRKKEVCPLDAATSHTLLINYLGRSFRVLCVKRTCSDCKTPPSTNSKTTTNRQKKKLCKLVQRL